MTSKERLHKLVDELSDAEAQAALELVVSRRDDRLARRLDSAPLEDEEITTDEEAAVQAARDELTGGGQTVPLQQVMRELHDA